MVEWVCDEAEADVRASHFPPRKEGTACALMSSRTRRRPSAWTDSSTGQIHAKTGRTLVKLSFDAFLCKVGEFLSKKGELLRRGAEAN
eukprot:636092-Pleurochrysis_carterae.AAC.1